MKIIKFEDLDGWKKARGLANVIYNLTDQGKFKRDFRLCSQIRDASGSVMHNIAEGFDFGSDAECIRF
jgi:four helix bundle protein